MLKYWPFGTISIGGGEVDAMKNILPLSTL